MVVILLLDGWSTVLGRLVITDQPGTTPRGRQDRCWLDDLTTKAHVLVICQEEMRSVSDLGRVRSRHWQCGAYRHLVCVARYRSGPSAGRGCGSQSADLGETLRAPPSQALQRFARRP